MGIDGTVYDVPDSDANAAAFGRPSAGPRGDGAFPQVRKLSLVELGTHVEVGLVVEPSRCGEQTMVAGLAPPPRPGDAPAVGPGLLQLRALAEAGDARGVKVLARVTTSADPAADPRPGRRLVPGQDLQGAHYDRRKDRDGIVVRVIRYTLDDPQRVGHGEVHVLITNLLDEALYPAMELIMLYHESWEQELVFDEQKTHQDPRRATKPAHLRSETPAGVIQEIYALSLGHFVIRSLMFEAAATVGLDPDRLSFTGLLPDPEVPAAGVRQPRRPRAFEAWYRGAALGDAGGADATRVATGSIRG